MPRVVELSTRDPHGKPVIVRPSIEELRTLAVEADVKMIACQMTMDLFEYKLEDMIEGPVLGGAATYIENATKCDINLFI